MGFHIPIAPKETHRVHEAASHGYCGYFSIAIKVTSVVVITAVVVHA